MGTSALQRLAQPKGRCMRFTACPNCTHCTYQTYFNNMDSLALLADEGIGELIAPAFGRLRVPRRSHGPRLLP
jgi:hypothetical protein